MRRRAKLIAARKDFKKAVSRALEMRGPRSKVATHVEGRIYEKFVEAERAACDESVSQF